MNRGNPVLKWPFNQNYSWQLIQEVTTKPRTTFKALQDLLISIKLSVPESTIGNCLSKNYIRD